MLQGWFDESGRGKAADQPVFVIAGYAGPVETFENFSDAWQECIADTPSGKSSLGYVKGKEANALSCQFAGWSEEERDHKLTELVGLIRSHGLIALSVAVNYRAFNKVLREPKPPMNYPYALAFAHIVTWLLSSASHLPKPNDIELIFDGGLLGRERVINAAYRGMQEALPPDMLALLREKPRFEDDKRFMPLQAADLFAWNVRRDYAEQLVQRRRWTSIVWEELRKDIRGKALYLGETELRKFRNQRLTAIVEDLFASRPSLKERL